MKSIILESNLDIFLHGLKILDLYPGIESIRFLGLCPVSVTSVQVLSAIQVSGTWFHVVGTDPRCPEAEFRFNWDIIDAKLDNYYKIIYKNK